MDVGDHVRKSFAYAVRENRDGAELLAFRSLEEPEGFEVPKGAAEFGESFADAARRELQEESGLVVGEGIELGTTWYLDEEQRFLLFSLEKSVTNQFPHTVTGHGGDRGLVYEFEFLPVDERLASRLVQGSGAFAPQLAARLAKRLAERHLRGQAEQDARTV